MGTQGIDVILGRNLLHKNQTTVSYDKRTVKLVSPFEEEIITELIMPDLEEGACHICLQMVKRPTRLRSSELC
jgi:hypothetical protein